MPGTNEQQPVADEHVGRTFGGKYRVEHLLAKGGMGRVYRATQFPLERPVALKILNRGLERSDPQFARRFTLEAATAAKLSHPHTITIFDYGEAEGGELYIAMEYLRGRTLSKVIAEGGPLAPDRALRIAIQTCRAVREAHGLGIIHRDLKPGNIFLVEEGDEGDYAKVLDFGLVKLFRPDASTPASAPATSEDLEAQALGEDAELELTRTGTLLGSPKYMSPEQIQGHPLDPRTDVYSLGVILFQMIAGKAPYVGATGVDVIYKHVHAPIPSVAEIAPDVVCPAPIEAIIHKCMQKQREDRFASMDDLVSHLKEALRLVTDGGLALPEGSPGDTSSSLRPLDPRPLPALADVAPIATPDTSLTPAQSLPPSALAEDLALRGPRATSRPSVGARPAQPSRTTFYLALGGFLLALAALLWVTVVAPRTRPASDPAMTAAPEGGAPRSPGDRGEPGTEPPGAKPGERGGSDYYRQNPY